MDEERGGLPGPVPRRPMSAPTALLGILIAASMAPSIAAGEASIGLAEAAEQGTFNVGTAHAVVARVSDPAAGGEVLKLTYTIPRGTTAGMYAKGFPAELRADHIDLLRVGVKSTTPEQSRQVTAAIEIKGSAGVQRIALELQPDWHPVEQAIDWPAIGAVKEVVVLVNGINDREPATGTLLIDARFEQLSPLRRLSMSLAARFVGIILAGLALSFLAGLLGSIGLAIAEHRGDGGWRNDASRSPRRRGRPRPAPRGSHPGRRRRADRTPGRRDVPPGRSWTTRGRLDGPGPGHRGGRGGGVVEVRADREASDRPWKCFRTCWRPACSQRPRAPSRSSRRRHPGPTCSC